MAPSTILAMALAVLARVWLLQTVPLFALYPYAGVVVGCVAFVRLAKAFSLATRRKRAHYEAPETGLPWTSFLIGPRPRPNALGVRIVEPLTAIGLSFAIMEADHALVPPMTRLVTLTQLPALAPWDAWMARHPLDAAHLVLFLPWIMLMVHNWREWRSLQPRRVRQRTVAPPALFPRVRERRLRLPPV